MFLQAARRKYMPEVRLCIERAVARVFVVSAEPIRVHSTCMKVPSAPHVVVRTASLALPLQSVKFVYSSLTVYALPALYFIIFRVHCGNQPHTSCSAAASAALHGASLLTYLLVSTLMTIHVLQCHWHRVCLSVKLKNIPKMDNHIVPQC